LMAISPSDRDVGVLPDVVEYFNCIVVLDTKNSFY